MHNSQKSIKLLKEGGYYFLVMTATLIIVLASFSASLGVKNTLDAFVLGISGFNDIVAEDNSTEVKSIITGTGDEQYENLDLTNYTVLPINITSETSPPFLVPTTGIAAHQNFLYDPFIHPGVDIWTQANGKGNVHDAKGNKVYAACKGVVTRIFYPNQEIEITCERISDEFKDQVPSLEVKILYSHLGDGLTKQQYHNLHLGQELAKGEFVGNQGNISSFSPQNRVVHLHFGVYDLKTRRPIDPTYYIGVSATTLGQTFKSGVED